MTGNKGPFSRCIIIIKAPSRSFLDESLAGHAPTPLGSSVELAGRKRGVGTQPGSFLQWNGGRSTMNGGHLFAFSIVRLHRGPAIVCTRTEDYTGAKSMIWHKKTRTPPT